MTEDELAEKLLKIERLFAGAATKGERDAAAFARERIRAKLDVLEDEEKPEEFKFSMRDQWSRGLFTALLRRYGIQPYRYSRQRYTTVMAKMPRSFMEETVWPEFQELSSVLHEYLSEVTNRIIREHIFEDSSDAGISEGEEPDQIR
jgi:hypothetical protein